MKSWVNHKEKYTKAMERKYNHTLKDCPFCNCEAEIQRTHTKYWWVECLNCGSSSGSRYGAKNAVRLWNQRTSFALSA